MPRGQDRVENSQAKALETITALHSTTILDEQGEPVTPSAQVVNLPVQDSDEQPKKKPAAKQQNNRLYWDKVGGEDFFEYLNSISQEERAGARLKFYTVNQDGSVGGVVHQIVGGWEDVDEGWMLDQANLGVGKYKVELRNSAKSGRKNEYTFLQIGSDDEIRKQQLRKQGVRNEGGAEVTSELHGATKGIDAFATATEKGMGFLEKSYEKAIERAQSASDPSAMVAAMAKVFEISRPAANNNEFILTMLDNQRKEAAERAERDRKEAIDRAAKEKEEAENRAKRDLQAANDRAERDNKFFQLLMDNSEKRSAERAELIQKMNEQQTKFFEALLKEKEKKEDSLGMGDVLKELFGAFARERLEGGGNDTLPGWAGVVQTALPKVADAVSTFMAVRAGASPQQIQQLQAAQNQQTETAHGPNGQQLNPAPVSPLVSADQQLVDFINRLGQYVSSHENPDPEYMLGVISEEYGPIEDWIFRTPQDQIVAMLQNNQLGQRLLAIPNAPPFIEQLIMAIKAPGDEQEPEIINPPATAQQYVAREAPQKPKKRKSAAN